jgi:MYXO-CTERM domain-containing protein
MKALTRSLLIVWGVGGSFAGQPGHGGTITATITADNHYGLYYGRVSAAAVDLAFVGRNEFGHWGSGGGDNWAQPETFAFSVMPGDHLYVVAWDDYGNQMWLAQFRLPDGSNLFSNTRDWEYAAGPLHSNPGYMGDVPSVASLADVVSHATWSAPRASSPNGTGYWGTIPGISSSADFVWSDSLTGDTNNDTYFVYRTRLPALPEPGDVDLDGDVDIFDVAVLQAKYNMTSGAKWADGDFDGNGTVDIFDVALMQVNYGHGVASSPSPVPEPSTALLAMLGLAGLLYSAFRRQRRLT